MRSDKHLFVFDTNMEFSCLGYVDAMVEIPPGMVIQRCQGGFARWMCPGLDSFSLKRGGDSRYLSIRKKYILNIPLRG